MGEQTYKMGDRVLVKSTAPFGTVDVVNGTVFPFRGTIARAPEVVGRSGMFSMVDVAPDGGGGLIYVSATRLVLLGIVDELAKLAPDPVIDVDY